MNDTANTSGAFITANSPYLRYKEHPHPPPSLERFQSLVTVYKTVTDLGIHTVRVAGVTLETALEEAISREARKLAEGAA